jgi:DHA2 family multidrug resistance protein
MASASGLSGFMRNLGASFGTAMMVSMWDHRAIGHHAGMVEHITPFDPAATAYFDTLTGLGLDTRQALATLDNTINVQGFLMATNDMQIVGGLLMLALIVPIWFARPPFTVEAGEAH